VIVLVDTSVWSLAFRRNQNDLNSNQIRHLNLLQEIILEGRARLLGLVRQELLTGIRHHQQFAKLQIALRAYEDAAVVTEDYETAASIANRCRAAGIAGNPIDFLICAVALRHKWAILTLDADFRHYSMHVPLTLL
jgi:predicted nucleic acid-binding protein